MVQFKRKPVQYLSVPRDLNKDAEIWVMRHTGEVFTSYESYLKRYDYYRQKKFTCDITGHSGLTFFEALESETEGSREVESNFPDALREPVLRKVQFSTVGRLDDLVTQLHEIFKEDFFPGETVSVIGENGERATGVIRDKASFSRHVQPDGTLVREAMSRYFVNTSGPASRMILVDNKHMFRDRKMFSKQVLKSFLKNSTRRDAWAGAPWLVKDDLAILYNIKRTIPPSLQQEAVAAEKKAMAALKKEAQGHKIKGSMHQMSRQMKGSHVQNSQGGGVAFPAFASKPGAHSQGQSSFANRLHGYHPTGLQAISIKSEASPPVTIKYPIDDLEIHPTGDGISRPKLKFLLNTSPLDKVNRKEGLQMSSVGPLLEIWNTLNVHCEVFQLDSFTFDDFADAMEFSSEDVECELFVEIHCAVLKMLVEEDGNINVTLPELPDEDDSEEEFSAENSNTSSPAPEDTTRRMRSANKQSKASTNGVSKAEEPSAPIQIHKAAEMLAENGWIDRLQKRDFRDGGWQVIMIGMLHQLSLKPNQKEACDQILAHLAPVHLHPTRETARRQYLSLDVNSRVTALEMATILAVQTKTLREYMEECSEQMTVYRKQKIEWQRQRKTLIEDLKALDEQRKLLLPDEPEVDPDSQETPNEISEEHLQEDGHALGSTDTEDEVPHRGHALRRGNDRANERKRKRDEEIARKEKEKKLKAEASKEPPQLRKVRKDIEKKKDQIKVCEEHVATLDGDLRENACQRTKVLGRDRFWNRYYWFERNGMPFGGIPSSSTSQYGYANGRLWVQGPDELEREGFINLSEPEMSRYRLAFGVSVPERKIQEEGETSLNSARQWGFYDDPEDLDTLIGWLDDRGKREKDLRKELTIWRDKISEYMAKLKTHLAENAITKAGSEEPIVGIATRKKTYVDNSSTRHPCLNWKNTYAIENNGHLHSEQPKPKKKYARANAIQKVTGSLEKLSTRSGTRYNRN